jgi:hypothetical protein
MASSLGFGSSINNLKGALLMLAFAIASPWKGLAGCIRKLVGSFFNRHTITPLKARLWLLVGIMVSGTISPASTAYFSPFPHGTSSLSGISKYLAFPD